jgi:hypothetical protein
MLKIIGYGEDALTLWGLKYKINEIMKECKKAFKISENLNPHIIFYRPSFGRNKSEKCFGEADALIVAGSSIFIVESKWQHSGEIKFSSKTIELRPTQIIRSIVFENNLRLELTNNTSAKAKEKLNIFDKKFVFEDLTDMHEMNITEKKFEYIFRWIRNKRSRIKEYNVRTLVLVFNTKKAKLDKFNFKCSSLNMESNPVQKEINAYLETDKIKAICVKYRDNPTRNKKETGFFTMFKSEA